MTRLITIWAAADTFAVGSVLSLLLGYNSVVPFFVGMAIPLVIYGSYLLVIETSKKIRNLADDVKYYIEQMFD